MPFSCVFQLNNGIISDSDRIIFVDYINSNFKKYHKTSEKIACIIFNGKPGFILSTCPCYFSKTGNLKRNDLITDKSEIAYFDADGESIPYNLPYAMIKVKRRRIEYIKRKEYLYKVNRLIGSISKFCNSLIFEAPSKKSKDYYDYPRKDLQRLIGVLKILLKEEDYIRGTMILQEIKERIQLIGASSTKGEIEIARPELLNAISRGIYIFQEKKYSNVNWRTI